MAKINPFQKYLKGEDLIATRRHQLYSNAIS